MSTLERPNSKKLFESLCRIIPGGVNSPARAFKGLGVTPLAVERAEGDMLYDPDGNSYIDNVCSWGAIILGHKHPAVQNAVIEQMEKGLSFVNSNALELKHAELICKYMPAIEKVRMVSSGTEATMTAIRLARGFTEKNLLVKFDGNYHGHSDPLLIKAGSAVALMNEEASSKGVGTQETVSLPYNDCDALQAFFDSHGDQVGVVIIEPIAGNMGCVPSDPEFLQLLRSLTTHYGAVLIFDEVISGFRVGLHGATGYYGITPDLICLGKIIGGGLPIAAFGGRADIMDHLAPLGEVFQAGTLSGNPIALAAGIAVLERLPGIYDELNRKARIITDALKNYLPTNQIGALFTCFIPPEQFSAYFSFMLSKGIYMPQSPFESTFISLAHTDEHLAYTRDAIIDFLSRH